MRNAQRTHVRETYVLDLLMVPNPNPNPKGEGSNRSSALPEIEKEIVDAPAQRPTGRTLSGTPIIGFLNYGGTPNA